MSKNDTQVQMQEFRKDLYILCSYYGIGDYLMISDDRASKLITNHIEAMRSLVRPPKKWDKDPQDPKLANYPMHQSKEN